MANGKKIEGAISPAVKKRISYIISDIMGTGAIISIVGLALAGVAVAAAYFLPAREIPKRPVEAQYYAPLEAGFIRRMPELVDAASTVPKSKQIARDFFETCQNTVNPGSLLKCAQQIDAAVAAAEQFNFEDAKAALDAARITWQKTVHTGNFAKETVILLDRIIFAKQKLVEAEAYQKIAKAEATLEVIGSSLELEIGRAPSNAAESLLNLSLMKKEITRLKDAASTQDSTLKGYFKNTLAKINILIAKLEKAK